MTSASPALFVGAISGTSMDGIDLAVIKDATPPEIIAGRTVPFDGSLHERLAGLAYGEINDLDVFGATHAELGSTIAAAILEFIADLEISRQQVRAIGSHGQTVRHRPDGANAFTLQIGDPNRIAELTGIDTIADLRGRDIAAGGQGAPLVPAFHRSLFGASAETRAILNVGGIANLTVLPSDSDAKMAGFDTGPGNALLDAWIERSSGRPIDLNGDWSAGGSVQATLLDELKADPYFERPPPKSTGKEYFNLGWLAERQRGLNPQDVQATLAQLTAETIADALRHWGAATAQVIVCGGGRLNADVMARLSRALPDQTVGPCETLGYSGDWIEAAAFAWLAARHLAGEPGNAWQATGAAGPRTLGAFHPGH